MLYTSMEMVYDVARIHIAKKAIFIMWMVYNVAGWTKNLSHEMIYNIDITMV